MSRHSSAAPVLCGAGYAVGQLAFLPLRRARGTPGFRQARSLMRMCERFRTSKVTTDRRCVGVRRQVYAVCASLTAMRGALQVCSCVPGGLSSTAVPGAGSVGRGLNLCLARDASVARKAAASRSASRDAHETLLRRSGITVNIILDRGEIMTAMKIPLFVSRARRGAKCRAAEPGPIAGARSGWVPALRRIA